MNEPTKKKTKTTPTITEPPKAIEKKPTKPRVSKPKVKVEEVVAPVEEVKEESQCCKAFEEAFTPEGDCCGSCGCESKPLNLMDVVRYSMLIVTHVLAVVAGYFIGFQQALR